MQYGQVEKAVFLERPNRFTAVVERQGGREVCHVKNTGRCKEILTPGAEVYLEKSKNPNRKTAYDLIAVKKGGMLINMDSQAPNAAAKEWIENGGLALGECRIRREVRYGNSRFDLYLETRQRRAFMEVKGVTLEEQGVARFPDAPTERGIKHIRELMACMEEGFDAYLLFVIQMKGVSSFEPNDRTHAAFGEELRRARDKGVHILAYDCRVQPESMVLDSPVLVRLDRP